MALGIAGLGVAIFALVSVIIALAVEYWMYYSVSSGDRTVKYYSGLFKGCVEGSDVKTCSTSGMSDALKGVAAMVFLALFAIVGAIVCQGLKLFVMKDQKRLLFCAVGLMVAAGVFLLIGFSVYVAEEYNPLKSTFDLHAGFAFCIIAWLASWVSAALMGVDLMKEK